MIERIPKKKKLFHVKIIPQVIDISDEEEEDGKAYSHAHHEHCHELAWHYYHPVSNTIAPLDSHHHCDHELEDN